MVAEGLRRERTRRRFLVDSGLCGGAILAPAMAFGSGSAAAPTDPWVDAAAIVARLRPPAFPDREFTVTAFGAVGDGRTDCTKAIAAAIKACNRAGGGHVVVPAGRFATGGIRLRRNVDLHVATGATLLFSTDPRRYLPTVLTRFEGNDCYNFAPLIYAHGIGNIAVSGGGTLDGRASNAAWWPWRGDPAYGWRQGQPTQFLDSDRLRAQGEARVPVAQRVYGDGHYLRPSFIQFHTCDRALIEGVTIRNAPSWVIHPVLCTNLTIRRVGVSSFGPNNDGCDLECCRTLLLEDCTFDTGDDCIAVKSGRGQDGFVPGIASSEIVLRRCELRRGIGGIAIGSEISGGVRNLFAEDIAMTDTRLARGLFVKSNTYRGGTVENIHLRRLRLAGVQDNPIRLTYHYLNKPLGGPYQPHFRNIDIANLSCGRSGAEAIQIRGYPDNRLGPVRLTDCTFAEAGRPGPVLQDVQGIELTRVTINGRTV